MRIGEGENAVEFRPVWPPTDEGMAAFLFGDFWRAVFLRLLTLREEQLGDCWWCMRQLGLRVAAVSAVVGTGTHYCERHWRAYRVLVEWRT